MAGPWEKYQTTEAAAPWEQYSAPEAGGFRLGGLRENIVGEGAVDTPGEIVGDVIGTGAAGIARGVKGLAELPEMAGRGAVWLSQTLMGVPKGDRVAILDTATGNVIDEIYGGMAEAEGYARDYVQQRQGETRAAEFAGTIGEFLPGGVVQRGRGLVQMAAAGTGSELAGQLTEGTAAEPFARVAGGLAGGLAGGIATTPKPSQVAKAPDDIADAVAVLERYGVRGTRGQVLDSDVLMKMEGTLAATPKQLDELTSAALRTAGINNVRATPKVLSSGQKQITNGMNDILKGVDVPVTPTVGQRALSVADDYFTGAPSRELPVPLRKVADELRKVAQGKGQGSVSAEMMRKWRSTLGSYTTSKNELIQDAAHALREVIDDATEQALVSLGRQADVAKLADLRTQYRNFLAIVKSVNYSGREAARGVITPERLGTATRRVFGEQNYALGRGLELPDLARSSVAVLGAKSTVTPGGVRDILTPGVLGVAGAGAGVGMANPLAAVALGAGGLAAPAMGKAAMRSGLGQTLLTQPSTVATSPARLLPGLLAQRGTIE